MIFNKTLMAAVIAGSMLSPAAFARTQGHAARGGSHIKVAPTMRPSKAGGESTQPRSEKKRVTRAKSQTQPQALKPTVKRKLAKRKPMGTKTAKAKRSHKKVANGSQHRTRKTKA